MKMIILVLFLGLFCFVPLTVAKNQVLQYEPHIVNLTGVIKIKTFPGAPNYESIEGGDDIETCPYLFLDHPVDVTATPNDAERAEAETEKNVKVMQISLNEKSNWDDKYAQKHVLVTGVLFHRAFAHHHTRVLLSAKQFAIEPIKNKL